MDQKIRFLLAVDVSGSMYGQKIAAVNANLRECATELRRAAETKSIEVGIVTFAEEMEILQPWCRPEQVNLMDLQIQPRNNGFYGITSFKGLYRGLKRIFDGENDATTYIILFTDARPVDSGEYEQELQSLMTVPTYRNAVKYLAYVGNETEIYDNNTVRFVDRKAERIVPVSQISGELGKLIAAAWEDPNRYKGIFD